MRIWLITIGEPVPVNKESQDRLHRTGYLAYLMAEHGHQVVWWTSAFDHFRKAHLFSRDMTIKVDNHLEIRLLHGGGYSSNLSPIRILDHRRIAAKFAAIAPRLPVPDVILCSFPTIELSSGAVRYGRQYEVPVVLDMRDMWPDILVDTVPKLLQFPAKLLAWPMLRDARSACAEASAITGITEAFVDWGLERGSRTRSWMDRAFPMGYISKAPGSDRIIGAEKYWNDHNVPHEGKDFVVCFFGTLGRQLDLDTVILAARKLQAISRPALFVICGTGDRMEHFRRLAAGDSNVLFPGWVDAAQIYVLMRRSAVGLDPLPDRYDFLATINNKAIEYMSAGLPVILSPDRGVLCELLKEHQCGMSYPHGNADALAELLAKLYDDRTALRGMAENSARLFHEMFTAEKVYAEMMEHLVKIVEFHNSGSAVSASQK